VDRRYFLKTTGRVAALATLSALPISYLYPAHQARRPVRIRPLTGISYPPQFLAYIDKARFKTPRDAIAAVRDKSLGFELVYG
jgi:hypothetical protein